MKLTKNSELLLSFFIKKKCIKHLNQTPKTDAIIKKLYKSIYDAYKYVKDLKGEIYEKKEIIEIKDEKDIPMSKKFRAESIPNEVLTHIKKHSKFTISYTFSLYNKKIKVNFIEENSEINERIQLYTKYIETIAIWLCIDIKNGEQECSKELDIFLYMTSLKKQLPKPNNMKNILGENNVNTAFTSTCPIASEIIIYRKEEWFKVLIHESMHNFALDFSDMNMKVCHEKILDIFPVDSEVNLYEAYTEIWAEIMNALFCSFFVLKDKIDVKEFLDNSEFFLNFERNYSFFQMTKTLDYMGIKYKDLYLKNSVSDLVRKKLYRENSNVLSYYVIKTIMLNAYPDFLKWCETNNGPKSILQFKKTERNLASFCDFIEKHYKTSSMLNGVKCAEKYLGNYKDINLEKRDTDKSLDYLLNNMRMTICELG